MVAGDDFAVDEKLSGRVEEMAESALKMWVGKQHK